MVLKDKLDGPARWTSWMGQLDGPAGRTSRTDQLDEPDGQTSWTDQLDRPAGRTSWTDQLDGPVGWTSWTDQFFLFEALASLHIKRLSFQFVHCRSFRVRRRPCFLPKVFFDPKCTSEWSLTLALAQLVFLFLKQALSHS